MACEKLSQYGLPALTDAELLTITGCKSDLTTYYQSPQFRAAKELARRQEYIERPKFMSSQNTADYLGFLREEQTEFFCVLLLNNANRLIKSVCVGRGGITATAVDFHGIFKEALECRATAIIAAHNHPSGKEIPSNEDKSLTRALSNAGSIMRIKLLDHVIITQFGHYSFADNGEI